MAGSSLMRHIQTFHPQRFLLRFRSKYHCAWLLAPLPWPGRERETGKCDESRGGFIKLIIEQIMRTQTK